jgi:4-carboxymuconolactone decarboxylase
MKMTSPAPIDRLPPIPPEQWTPAQRTEAEAMMAGPRKAVVSPFVPLLRSPELAGHVQRLGAYLRYRSAVGTRLTELAVLITAAYFDQAVEWAIHAPIAQKEGVALAIIAALERHEKPSFAHDDEAIVYAYCTELLSNRGRVSDSIWQQAVVAFGENGVMDLTGICGYYGLLALVMNAAQTQRV